MILRMRGSSSYLVHEKKKMQKIALGDNVVCGKEPYSIVWVVMGSHKKDRIW